MTDLSEEFQSRREYRQQMERQMAGQNHPDLSDDQLSNDENEPLNRHTALENDHEDLEAAKTSLLKHKLNIAIMILIALIVLVYIILFFVG